MLLLTLALFVTRVATNHQQAALSPYQLTILTDALDAGPNLHDSTPGRNNDLNFGNRYCKQMPKTGKAFHQSRPRDQCILIRRNDHDSLLRNRESMFHVHAGQAIPGDNCPVVSKCHGLGLSHINHGLDC